MRETTASHLGAQFDELMGALRQPDAGAVEPDDMRRCFFGDFMDPSLEPHERM